MSKTRVFFVVLSDESNEEIFTTLEEAKDYLTSVIATENGREIRVALVRHAYYEKDLRQWNYEDFSDTFQFIKNIYTTDSQERNILDYTL